MAVEIIRHRRSRVDKNEEDVYKSYASHEFFSVDDLILMVNVLVNSTKAKATNPKAKNNSSAAFGLISPVVIGLSLVLTICLSISRSA